MPSRKRSAPGWVLELGTESECYDVRRCKVFLGHQTRPKHAGRDFTYGQSQLTGLRCLPSHKADGCVLKSSCTNSILGKTVSGNNLSSERHAVVQNDLLRRQSVSLQQTSIPPFSHLSYQRLGPQQLGIDQGKMSIPDETSHPLAYEHYLLRLQFFSYAKEWVTGTAFRDLYRTAKRHAATRRAGQ